ncbi:MAG: CinA family nicotinamide mononucleotide deamidase-related protein [Planctomycetaceae bacterium]|nr:CinA family nicotinamide mononucleotide deamidase-related protein [Planctomycetaceae bacterium]
MFAEIIAIGTELTTGAKLDTNSQWLSQELAAVGIEVIYHTAVADNLDANLQVLKNATDRTQLVIITGGLGPTLDDLTREVIAQLLGVPLELDEESLAIIQGMFARRQRPMPERNRIQAMFPAGSEVIPNPRGTAPGIWAKIERTDRPSTYLAALPGVPTEMKGMFREGVVPRLLELGVGGKSILSHRINCFGLGESQAEEMLGDLTKRGRDPEVGITVHEGTITLRIEAHGATREECETKIHETSHLAQERLGQAVFGVEDEQLQDVLLQLVADHRKSMASIEIGTGGLLAEWLNSNPISPSVYRGGLVLASIPHGADLLKSSSEHAEVMSLEKLAIEFRSRLGTDFVLVVGEFPPDDPNTPEVPTTEIGLISGSYYIVRRLHLGGDPMILKSRIAKSALNLLRLHLLGKLENETA